MANFDFTTLVYDRTQADVDYYNAIKARSWTNLTDTEKAAWLEGLRGAYVATSDWNRVESAVAYLNEVLSGMGYSAVNGTKTDWVISDIPSQADMTRYIGNIQGLRAVFGMFATTPAAPESMNALDYSGANDIEKILLDLNTLVQNIPAGYIYSDEINCGEDDFI